MKSWPGVLACSAVLLVACDPNAPPSENKPNLVLWGPATEFTVDDRNASDPTFDLSLAVINFGLAPANGFQVKCDAIGTALFGTEPLPGSEISVVKDNVNIPAFDTTNINFSWKWPGLGQTVMWEIDCLADSAFNIQESAENDNAFTFRFEAFCTGTSPCTQTGGSLSAPPPPG